MIKQALSMTILSFLRYSVLTWTIKLIRTQSFISTEITHYWHHTTSTDLCNLTAMHKNCLINHKKSKVSDKGCRISSTQSGFEYKSFARFVWAEFCSQALRHACASESATESMGFAGKAMSSLSLLWQSGLLFVWISSVFWVFWLLSQCLIQWLAIPKRASHGTTPSSNQCVIHWSTLSSHLAWYWASVRTTKNPFSNHSTWFDGDSIPIQKRMGLKNCFPIWQFVAFTEMAFHTIRNDSIFFDWIGDFKTDSVSFVD